MSLGYYGKIPARGDFISRGLPADFIAAWDSWMVQAVAASRQILGGGWHDAFMTAPLWRFHCGTGVCGAEPATGVWLPSVDRVGREFPLVLAATGRHSPGQGWGEEAASWFRGMEDTALAVLEEMLEPDAISARLEAIHPIPAPAHAGLGSRRYPLIDPAKPLAAVPAAALLAAGSGADRVAIWWTEGSDLVEPSTLVSAGLPSPDHFTAMLAGDWENRGWRETNGQEGDHDDL